MRGAPQLWKRVRPAREDDGVRARGVGAQELTGGARECVAGFGADVRAADDVRPGRLQRRSKSRRLRVVKHDDVTHAQPSLEPDPSWLERALVDTLLEAAELPVVAGISVQQVVDALGDPKERRAAADHRPVGVDSSVEPVGRDRAQQLGDPASHRRGVDHPHRAPAQRLAAVGERELQRAPAVLGDHRPKAPEGKGASGISCGPWAGAVIACR